MQLHRSVVFLWLCVSSLWVTCNGLVATTKSGVRLMAKPTARKALNVAADVTPKTSLPCGDALDKRILALAIPAVLNFAILPLVGAVDTWWVGRMKEALALAGQAASNQVFSSSFWFISFLPSVITPLVAKAVGSGDTEAVKDRVGEAMFLGTVMGILGSMSLICFPSLALNMVLPQGCLLYTSPSPRD